MEAKLKLLPLIILFCLFNSSAKASHELGQELTYRYLGYNVYELTFQFYRDCAGVEAPNQVIVNCYSSCDSSFNATLKAVGSDSDNIVHECPSALSVCNGGTNLGIEKRTYKDTITLTGACSDWVFSTNSCCRNAADNNLNAPGTDALYCEAYLNNAVYNHNSPVFNADPVISVCASTWAFIDCSASDICDSLVYSLIPARSGSATNILYNSGYSATTPFGNVPTKLDSSTGLLTVFIPNVMQGVYVVLVQQYRYGVLIGSIMRDVVLYSSSCTNRQPQTSGINGSAIFTTIFPANKESCFSINSSDSDLVQATQLSWNAEIIGASFTTDSSVNQTAQFCWKPSITDTVPCPYCFTVQVADNNCPIEGVRTFRYCILVVDSGYAQGINDLSKEELLVTVAPNPFNEYTILSLKKPLHEKNMLLVINDLLGRTMLLKSIHENTIRIERANLASGMYFYSLVTNEEVISTGKLVIE